VVRGLVEVALRDGEGFVREAAAEALGALGAAAAQHAGVVRGLVDALRDGDAFVRRVAAEALGALMRRGVRIFRRRGLLPSGRVRWEVLTVTELSQRRSNRRG
jgi:HEAT repeat protein